MNTGRYVQGLNTATRINPDMVDEMRVVVAAVDVEGRGSAQIQMRTRSGTNQFHGGADVERPQLRAECQFMVEQPARHFADVVQPASIHGQSRRTDHQEQNILLRDVRRTERTAEAERQTPLVLTDAARQGIFRFFPGVNNGNAERTASGSGIRASRQWSTIAGNPLDWTQIPGATGPMQSFNVFGDALESGRSVPHAHGSDRIHDQADRVHAPRQRLQWRRDASAAIPCDG